MRKLTLTIATFVATIAFSAVPALAGGHNGGGNPFQGTNGFLGSASGSAGLSSVGATMESAGGKPSFGKALAGSVSNNLSSANLGNLKVDTNSTTTTSSFGSGFTTGPNAKAATNAASTGTGSSLGQFSWGSGDCGCGN